MLALIVASTRHHFSSGVAGCTASYDPSGHNNIIHTGPGYSMSAVHILVGIQLATRVSILEVYLLPLQCSILSWL